MRKREKRNDGIKKFALVFLFGLLLCLPSVGGAVESDRSGKTGKTIEELSSTEKAEIDLRTDTPRDAQRVSLPAKPYSFESPSLFVKTPAEFFLRPLLYHDTFPDMRTAGLAPEGTPQIRAQEATGQLVFEITMA